MKQYSSSSQPLPALALLLLLLCFLHSAAAARLLPPGTATPLAHQEDATAAGAEYGVMDQGTTTAGGAGEISGGKTATRFDGFAVDQDDEEEACEEGSEEQCLQRRLLHDAHLDYIYTQRHRQP